MDFLLSIATPDIAVLTPVEPNHLEQFGTLEHYREHKIKLLQQATTRIIHESLRQYIELDALYYSLGALSDIDASHIEINISGTNATVHYNKKDYAIQLPAIGAFQIENLLPLYAIADILSIDPNRVSRYALHGSPESGRSSVLSGIDDTTIIDGSYNGGYLSIREGIISMRSFIHSHRIIFLLGDMRELGTLSRDVHERLAHEICDLIPHESRVVFYLVGPMMRDYTAAILGSKFQVIVSLSSRDLGEQILRDIRKNTTPTIVYAK